jgi:hypothetical protein
MPTGLQIALASQAQFSSLSRHSPYIEKYKTRACYVSILPAGSCFIFFYAWLIAYAHKPEFSIELTSKE